MERKAFEVSAMRDKTRIENVEDWASYSLDAGEAPAQERIFAYRIFLRDLEKLREGFSERNAIEQAENRAFDEVIAPWLRDGDGEYLLWISPPAGFYYGEARFILSKRVEEEGEVFSENIAFPGSFSGDECVRIANGVGGEYDYQTVDLVRERPVVFDADDVVELLSQHIDAPLVWEKIRTGEYLEDNRRVREVADKVISGSMGLVYRSKTESDYIKVGAMMENELERYGYKISCGVTGCGISNRGILERRQAGAFDVLYSSFVSAAFVHTMHEYSGPCSRCREWTTATNTDGTITCSKCGASAKWPKPGGR